MNELSKICLEIIKNVGAGVPLLRHIKEKHSRKRISLLQDIERFFSVFQNFEDRIKGIVNLEGKNILEIGCGNSLALGLLFLARGANKVFLVDKFKHLFWDSHDVAFHRNVFKKIEKGNFQKIKRALDSVVITNDGKVDFNENRIKFMFGDAADLPLADASVDLVFSNAVFEHVHDVKKSMEEMYRVTKPGGLGLHEIDLRDHFSKDEPLCLLKYPDWLWNIMTWNRPGYTNRLRFSDWIAFFNQLGFSVKKTEITRYYSGDFPGKINKKFTFYDREELRTLVFFIMVEKSKNSGNTK